MECTCGYDPTDLEDACYCRGECPGINNINEFKSKYGEVGWRFLIEEFIRRAPEFPGDRKIAAEIGIMCADLESALRG